MTASSLPKPSAPSPLANSSTPSDHDPRDRTPSPSPSQDDDATSQTSEDYHPEWLGFGRPSRGASHYGPMDDEYYSDEGSQLSFNDDSWPLANFSASIFDGTPWAPAIDAAGCDDVLETYVTIALKQLDDENHFPTLFIRFLLDHRLADLAHALDLSEEEARFARAADAVLPRPLVVTPEPKPEPKTNGTSTGKAPAQPQPQPDSLARANTEKDKALLRQTLASLVTRLDHLAHLDHAHPAPRYAQILSQTTAPTPSVWTRLQEYAAHIAYLGLLAHNEMKARALTAAQMDVYLKLTVAPLGEVLAGGAGAPLRQMLVAAATGWTPMEYRALLAGEGSGESGIAKAALRRGAKEAGLFAAGK